jgi:hypothetical protein
METTFRKIFGKFLALSLSLVLLFTSGCRTTVSVTPTIGTTPGGGIQVGVTIRIVIENLVNNFGSEQYVAILDSAKQWRPTANGSPKLQVTILRNGEQPITAEFDMALNSALSQQIDPVDKNTVPYAFVVANQAALASFLDNNLSGQTSGDFEAKFAIPIEQIDCQTVSGKYINHVRSKDSTGIVYYDSFYYQYVAPSSGSGCSGGSLSIAN